MPEPARPDDTGPPGLPLVGAKGTVLALVLALPMAWPMDVTTAPPVSFDTADYVADG